MEKSSNTPEVPWEKLKIPERLVKAYKTLKELSTMIERGTLVSTIQEKKNKGILQTYKVDVQLSFLKLNAFFDPNQKIDSLKEEEIPWVKEEIISVVGPILEYKNVAESITDATSNFFADLFPSKNHIQAYFDGEDIMPK